MTLAAPPAPAPQLDGVVATQSSICLLSADDNRLAYRGYDVRELAEQGTYEETAFLLLAGRLPQRADLKAFVAAVRAQQKLPRSILKLISAAPAGSDPMAVLRTAVSALGLEPTPPSEEVPAGVHPAALALTAQLPTLVAAIHRASRGERPVTPRRGPSVAANFLYMVHGHPAHDDVAGAFDEALILRADNELNPSTFAARIAAACRADLHGCVTAALAALAGPQHGGHALAVYKLLEEIATPARVQDAVDARIAMGKGFPGFGHPVYKGEDPRTAVMRRAAERACRAVGRGDWFELARLVEERARIATGKFAMVDFYLAPLYRAAEIPPQLFTPVFAVGRIAGWCAHIVEQYGLDGLIRPRAAYVGPLKQEYRSLRRRA
jgi:citrate synthase